MVRNVSDAWATPPSLRRARSAFLTAPFKALFGCCLSLLVLLLLLLVGPPLVLLRLCQRCRRGFDYKRPDSLLWPCGSLTRAVIWLRKEVEPSILASIISRRLSSAEGSLSRDRLSQAVQIWDQRKHRMTTVAELREYLNERVKGEDGACCSIQLIPNFLSPDNEEDCAWTCCLAVLSVDSRRFPFCVLRLISILSEGNITFEMEPRLVSPLASFSLHNSLPVLLADAIYRSIQLFVFAPWSLLSLACRSPSPIWNALQSSPSEVNGRRHTVADGAGEGDDIRDDLMESHPSQGAHAISWIPIERLDLLMRAERLLRASTVELMTSLVAGTLRANFREEGIRHPPDVGCTVPVGRDGSVESGVLLPILLPTSVEGAIPRLWAVQRRLAHAVKGELPGALRTLHRVGDALLSPRVNGQIRGYLVRDCTVGVFFIRVAGECLLRGNGLLSLLLQPPPGRVSFSFVQSPHSLVLSLLLDPTLFPHPERLLSLFQTETNRLLDHLSMRLLTLTQATFLPHGMPILRVEDEDDEDSEVFQPGSLGNGRRLSDGSSLSQLQQLLSLVQSQLDTMRANPCGDRAEYIQKLTELEEQMEAFHERMATQLGAGLAERVQADAALASTAVADLLAPYRTESGSGRRFSREFSLTDAASSSRKSSRSS